MFLPRKFVDPSHHTDAAPEARRSLRRLLTVITVLLGLAAPLFIVIAPTADAAATSTESRIQRAVLTTLNIERRAHHLPALRSNSHLVLSARRHNKTMAAHNTMSHQLKGEAFFANRIEHAGYHWMWAGENIGWNARMSSSGAVQLEKIMYAEKAPNDGHRLNILNKHFKDVGVSIYLDKKHRKLWLTTDFGRK